MPRFQSLLLLCLALVGATQTQIVQAETDKPLTVTVDITFSDKALAELTARGEGIVISTYWMGDPAPGATLPLNPIETIFLVSEEVTLHSGPARVVLGANFPVALAGQVTVPMMNTNVSSARWTSDDNLLDCDVLDAPFADLAAAPQALHCKLIGE